MTDVRLVATNPDDSSVVPVACNSRGELLIVDPVVENIPNDLDIEGNFTAYDAAFTGDVTVGGDMTFTGTNMVLEAYDYTNTSNDAAQSGWLKTSIVSVAAPADHNDPNINAAWQAFSVTNTFGTTTSVIHADGTATFSNDVTVGSRNQQWMIVESGGLAHMVSVQAKEGTSGASGEMSYPSLRDIPKELTMVEQQLQLVMERLRMAPEAGWEVWDGSDG